MENKQTKEELLVERLKRLVQEEKMRLINEITYAQELLDEREVITEEFYDSEANSNEKQRMIIKCIEDILRHYEKD